MKELVKLGTAFMFLTRLPVGRICSGDSAVLSRSTRYFPLVGCFVGGLLSLSLWLLQHMFPVSVSVALILMLSVLVTGALHEDGLADVADSAGGVTRDDKLEIMRDSRLGVYGVLALIILTLIKATGIWELAKLDLTLCLGVLISAHAYSRWSTVWLMANVPYARPSAANKTISDGVNVQQLFEATLCLLFLLLPVAYFVSPGVYVLLPVVWLVTWLCAKRFQSVYAGITGDCLGAANQIVECTVILGAFAIASWH